MADLPVWASLYLASSRLIALKRFSSQVEGRPVRPRPARSLKPGRPRSASPSHNASASNPERDKAKPAPLKTTATNAP